MRHDQDQPLLGDLLEDFHHESSVLLVQGTGGLVGQKDSRIVDQGADDADALLLSAGKVLGPLPSLALEVDFGKEALHPRLHVLRALGSDEADVLLDGEVLQESALLEDEADVPIPEAVLPLLVEAGDVLAVEEVLALVVAVERGQDVEEGRLPRPGIA